MEFPTTFENFYANHPDLIRALISKNQWGSYDDVADLEQEILSEFLRKKVIERFDPSFYDEPTMGLWVSYVKEVARRCFVSSKLSEKAHVRSLNHNSVSLSDTLEEDGTTTIGETIDDDGAAVRAMIAAPEFEAFAAHVIHRYPKCKVIMDAIRDLSSINSKDIAQYLGLKQSAVIGRMTQIRRLSRRWNHA